MVDKLNDDIGEEKRLQLWEMMLKLRLVEKKADDLLLQNLIFHNCTMNFNNSVLKLILHGPRFKFDYS